MEVEDAMAQPNTATSEDPKVLPVRASEGWGFFECWCVTRSTHGDTIYSYLDAMRRLIVALEDLEAHKSLKKVVVCLFLCGAHSPALAGQIAYRRSTSTARFILRTFRPSAFSTGFYSILSRLFEPSLSTLVTLKTFTFSRVLRLPSSWMPDMNSP